MSWSDTSWKMRFKFIVPRSTLCLFPNPPLICGEQMRPCETNIYIKNKYKQNEENCKALTLTVHYTQRVAAQYGVITLFAPCPCINYWVSILATDQILRTWHYLDFIRRVCPVRFYLISDTRRYPIYQESTEIYQAPFTRLMSIPTQKIIYSSIL